MKLADKTPSLARQDHLRQQSSTDQTFELLYKNFRSSRWKRLMIANELNHKSVGATFIHVILAGLTVVLAVAGFLYIDYMGADPYRINGQIIDLRNISSINFGDVCNVTINTLDGVTETPIYQICPEYLHVGDKVFIIVRKRKITGILSAMFGSMKKLPAIPDKNINNFSPIIRPDR